MYKRLKRLQFEVTHLCTKEGFSIDLPANYQIIFDAIDAGKMPDSDYENCSGMLCFFLDVYAKLSEDDKIEFQNLANCAIAPTNTIADLLKLILERYKYYRLYNVGNLYELGKARIEFMQHEYPNSPLAKLPLEDSYRIGEMIQKYQKGVFYRNDYYGLYDIYAEDD